MGLKTDTSFLKFVTMGAKAARQTITYMKERGLQPIELERYCTSNKIWQTKVKRLRLADLLCVETGLRVEVRAKSKLEIRMSDAPANPDRRWDVGQRDEDLVALVACEFDDEETATPSETPVFFSYADLRASVGTTKLGPPKSASEGAERDRTWPSTVPNAAGVVTEVTEDRIAVALSTGRNQSYRLNGKTPYVAVGDRFPASEVILAGSVQKMADLTACRARAWDPLALLGSTNAVDRYAAAKALPHSRTTRARAASAIRGALASEADPRVKLAFAGSLTRLGDPAGVECLRAHLAAVPVAEWHLEAVLILTEIGAGMEEHLRHVATDAAFRGSDTRRRELRQASVWGLGKAGARAYGELLDFVSDDDDDVALHAIAAFGSDTPTDVIARLVSMLDAYEQRTRASACQALASSGQTSS